MLVNIVGKVRDVDSSVGLSGDIEVVVSVLGEFVVPLKDDSEVVLATLFVVERAILETVAVGEANTCRLLDVKQVGLSVPRVLTLVENCSARLKTEGAILLHEAEH